MQSLKLIYMPIVMQYYCDLHNLINYTQTNWLVRLFVSVFMSKFSFQLKFHCYFWRKSGFNTIKLNCLTNIVPKAKLLCLKNHLCFHDSTADGLQFSLHEKRSFMIIACILQCLSRCRNLSRHCICWTK